MKRQTKNPYLPGWEYIPDGEPKCFGDRVYVYGSHDEARGKMYCTGDYVCWSAPKDDLSRWTFEGVSFRRCDDPNYQEEVYLAAPDVGQGPDGRYYLYYFTMKIDKIGVAVSDTPEGPFRYYGDVRFADGSVLTPKSGFGLPFDPAILSDENGNWLYYGFALQSRKEGFPEEGVRGGFAARLENDMLTIAGEPVQTIPGKLYAAGTPYENHAFLEASSIRRYRGQYYLVYSSEQGHELCYATASDPMGPFTYRGTIVSNGDVGLDGRTEADAVNYLGNNHGGLLELEGQLYIFYHRHTHGAQYSRQGCIERVSMTEDGSIPQVEITSVGASGEAWRAADEYSAHLACHLRSGAGILHYSSSVKWNEQHPYISQEGESGVATLQNQFIYNLRDGAVCGFKYLRFDGSESEIMLRLRGAFTGEVKVLLDHADDQEIAAVPMSPCEGWTWFRAAVLPVEGTHGVYFAFCGTGACDFDAFRFDAKGEVR